MRFLKDEKGQVLVVTALSMTVLFGFAAFATDVGTLLHTRRITQTVADSAAIAGAAESLYEGTPTSITSGMWAAASHDALLNGITVGSSNGVADSTSGVALTLKIAPNITVPSYNYSGYVQAVITRNSPTIFMGAFGALFGFQHQSGNSYGTLDVSTTAIASNTLQSKGCVYVQDNGNNDPSDTMDLNGHSLIAAPNCGVTVNGAISASGSSSINAKFVTASGSISGGDSSWEAGVPAPPDPLSYLQDDDKFPTYNATNKTCSVPSSWGFTGGCKYDYNGGQITSMTNNTIYMFDTSAPPVFPQNVTIGSPTPVTGVAIVLVGNVPLDFYNGTLNISPSSWTTGATSCGDPNNENPLCGVLVDAPSDGLTGGTYTCSSGHGNNANNPGGIYFDFGSSTVTLTGIVYAPSMQLFVQDQGASTSFNTDLVIGNICAQSGNITVNGFSGARSPIRRVGLVY